MTNQKGGKKARKAATAISTGLIILGSATIAPQVNAVHQLQPGPDQEAEIVQAHDFSSETFQALAAKSGVILAKDALPVMLGSAVSVEDVDVVTAPSLMPLP